MNDSNMIGLIYMLRLEIIQFLNEFEIYILPIFVLQIFFRFMGILICNVLKIMIMCVGLSYSF